MRLLPLAKSYPAAAAALIFVLVGLAWAATSVIINDGQDVTQGSKADPACGTDAGNCSDIALTKRTNQDITNATIALVGNNADGVAAAASSSVPSAAYNYGFNGTSWDRLQVDGSKNLKVSSTVTGGGGPVASGSSVSVVPGTSSPNFPVSGTVTANLASAATGGCTGASLIAANTDNATNVKNAAGTLCSLDAYSTTTTTYWIKLYNKASAPACGTDTSLIIARIAVPPQPASGVTNGVEKTVGVYGLNFPAGISFCIVTNLSDGDDTAVPANSVVFNYEYK